MTNPFLRSIFGELYCDPVIAAEFEAAAFSGRMLRFEAAWTEALRKLGTVSDEDAAVALDAIKRSTVFDLTAGSLRDGVPVPAFVAALRSGLNDGAANAIHTGATSQDVIDSAMSLTLLQVLTILQDRMGKVSLALDDLETRFGTAPLMARTRMQAALPTEVGLRLSAWRRGVGAQIKRAESLLDEVAVVQVGGPIGDRSALEGQGEAVAECVAASLGLRPSSVWHTERSSSVCFGHWLTLVAGTLGKIGQDIVLMAQQGVDEIGLSGGGKSSAMPHKQNPVEAEAMVSLARFVATQQGALAQAMIHEQERSGAAWALEWMTVPTMAESTGAALNNCLNLLSRVEHLGTRE